jgi:hypothetical protein
MNYKKIIIVIISTVLTVAIVEIISVGFSSCSKDEKEVVVIDSSIIMYKWYNDDAQIVEFKKDGTFFYEELNASTNGKYRITESTKEKYRSISVYYTLDDPTTIKVDTTYIDATLFNMVVSGNNNFDQLCMHYFPNGGLPYIVVDFYVNNELGRSVRFRRDYDFTID